MPFTVRTVPKVKEVAKVKDVLLKEKEVVKPKQLRFAVGAGGIPPSEGDGNPFKKRLTPEQISKILELVGDNNKILLNKKYYNNIYKKFN